MLTIKNLHVGYEDGPEVINGIDLSFETGKTHGIVGLNGAGKTTLLNTFYSLIKPKEGTIMYDDRLLSRRDIAYLEAENYFYPYMTGREYLQLFPEGESAFSMEEWGDLFAIPLNRITDSYSTGMRKRLAVLAVIKMDKPIIILDEPFNGLDLEGTHLLTMILARLHERHKTILVTSHIYETLTGSCDYIHYLNKGIIEKSYGQEQFPILQKYLQQTMHNQSYNQINELL